MFIFAVMYFDLYVCLPYCPLHICYTVISLNFSASNFWEYNQAIGGLLSINLADKILTFYYIGHLRKRRLNMEVLGGYAADVMFLLGIFNLRGTATH